MPDTNTQPKSQKVIQPKSDQKVVPLPPIPTGSTKAKEQEPVSAVSAAAEEDQLMAEITSTSEAMDAAAIERLQKDAPDIKRSQPQPELKPDVEDAGVKIPEQEADNVIRQGSTLSLPVSEKAYKKGQQTKVSGKIEGAPGQKIVVGVSSVAALAIWIGRLFKLAHMHAMKIVFRGKGS